jgi:uncharacterized membrane protein YtjA (UPF0391 family)
LVGRLLKAEAPPAGTEIAMGRTDPLNFLPRNTLMLGWSLLFLVFALIAGVLGFGGIAGTAVGIAKILFFIFLVLLVLSALISAFRGRPPI